MADSLSLFLKNFIKLEKTGFKLVFDRDEMRSEIIRLNTVEQLYYKGIDSEGVEIQPEGYSESTILYKREEGQRIENVTLNDSGAFYDSFEVIVKDDSFTINADGLKDEDDLFDIYGEDILGLTDDSFADLLKTIQDLVFEIIQNLKR